LSPTVQNSSYDENGWA